MTDDLARRLRELPPTDLQAPPDRVQRVLARARRRRARQVAGVVSAGAVVLVAVIATGVPLLSRSGATQTVHDLQPAASPTQTSGCDPSSALALGKSNPCGAFPAPAGPKPTAYTPPSSSPELGDQGVIDRVVPPFSSADGSVRNAWKVLVGGYQIMVLAGTQGQGKDAHAALLFSHVKYDATTPPLTWAKDGWYVFPAAASELKVLSGTESTVTVQTETGVTGTFDFRAGTWR
jgi:hypothetical protein